MPHFNLNPVYLCKIDVQRNENKSLWEESQKPLPHLLEDRLKYQCLVTSSKVSQSTCLSSCLLLVVLVDVSFFKENALKVYGMLILLM